MDRPPTPCPACGTPTGARGTPQAPVRTGHPVPGTDVTCRGSWEPLPPAA